MSGGEKSLVALALMFAVHSIRKVPFFVLDEVEAALDDTNLTRLLDYLNHVRTSTQLIIVSHQRRTMETADVLYGVTMQAAGVSKLVSQRLEQAMGYASRQAEGEDDAARGNSARGNSAKARGAVAGASGSEPGVPSEPSTRSVPAQPATAEAQGEDA
jgi:energy-coupling factor transporter ATP-binding protein EcfA2